MASPCSTSAACGRSRPILEARGVRPRPVDYQARAQQVTSPACRSVQGEISKPRGGKLLRVRVDDAVRPAGTRRGRGERGGLAEVCTRTPAASGHRGTGISSHASVRRVRLAASALHDPARTAGGSDGGRLRRRSDCGCTCCWAERHHYSPTFTTPRTPKEAGLKCPTFGGQGAVRPTARSRSRPGTNRLVRTARSTTRAPVRPASPCRVFPGPVRQPD